MANEFKVKNGLIVIGDLTTSGTITINGALAATQSWVTSQAYLTSSSLTSYATQSYVTSAIASLVDSAPGALDTLRELATALGNDASFSTTITNSIAAKLPLAGGTLTGALLMGNGVAAAANSQPTALSYGLLQAYGTFTLAADTDGSQSEFAIITAGYGVASASAANGLAIGFNTLTWKNNTVWHAGNLTNLNQLSNGPGYLTSYTETDTLASVTARGNTTTNSITVGNLTVASGASINSSWVASGVTAYWRFIFASAANNEGYGVGPGGFGIYREGMGDYHLKFKTDGVVNAPYGLQIASQDVATRAWVGSQGYLTSYSETDTLQSVTNRGGTTTNRLEFQYSVDRYSQAWKNTSTGAYWWVTTDADKLGLHRNGDGDKFYFSNTGDFYSVTNGWLSTALAAKQNASTAINTSNIGSQSVSYANNAGYAAEAGQVINQSGQLLRYDNRIISPSETTAGYLQFGFTSWGNDGGGPYADYLHMRSYTDGSGGTDNLVMFKKSGIGMRIWQQSWGSSSPYAEYVDVWTTANFTQTNVNNWNTAYGWGNHASAGYLTSVSDIWVNTTGDTMTGALTIQGGWASTILDGDNVVLRKPNYSSGGWARTLLNFQEYDTTSLFQIGGYGSNNTMSYGYLGSAYNTPTIKWYANKDVAFSGKIIIDDVLDNNRYQKGGSFLNLRDPYNNIHLYNNGSGVYVDSPIHYWRSTAADYWMTLNSTGLGIGTSSPEAKLHIVYGSGQAGFLSRGPSGDTWFPYTNGQNYVRGITNFDNASVYFTGGNVGIGTSSPSVKLHVEGPSSDGVPVFRMNGTTAPNAFNYAGSLMNSSLGSSRNTILLIGKAESNKDSGYIGFNHSGTNSSNSNFLTFGLFQNDNILNITGAGNVGIGITSPVHKLTFDNNTFISFNNDLSNPFGIGGGDNAMTRIVMGSASGASSSIQFGVGSSGQYSGFTSLMTIKSSGNIGINTTTPSYKLHVNGTFGFAGSLYGDGKKAIDVYDSWLRLNQDAAFGSGVYTPYNLRNDGAFDNYGGIYGYNTIRARKSQSINNYTTAALWTESYDNTTTGIAFHISGNVGKFLEMRTNGVLYWDNAQVWTAGTLTNLNQLSNGPGYITSSGSISGNAATATTAYSLSSNGGLTTQFGNATIGYAYAIANPQTGLFPASDNSNSILTVNRHPGDYYSQLGFSSNNNLYYRRFSATAINTSLAWQTIWTSDSLTNLNQLSNGPGYITSYSETDTLASVTARGASTSSTLNLDGRVNIGNNLTRPTALNSDAVAHARIGGSDVHLYVASLGAGGGYKVAVQAARYSDFQSFDLDLQSNGGTLLYGGNQVATRTWATSQFQPLENQRLSSGDVVRFANVYNTGWFRNDNNNTGLYNETNGNHFYSRSGTQWAITSNGSTLGALAFYRAHESVLEGLVYFDTDGFGLLNRSGGWAVRSDRDNNSVRLFYNNGERIRTDSSGAYVTGRLEANDYITTTYQYIGGQTSNGQSNYQWSGATYQTPGDWTARLILRRDNASTGVNGSIPSLVIFNNNGADQTTASMVFATNECVTGSNSVNLAGIVAKKESVGNCGGWSSGSLNFFVKNYATRIDSLALTPDGNATFSGIVYSTGYGNSSQWNTAYSWGNHASASYATTSYVTTQINNLVNGAPGALDTLNELATALGNDASFSTTVTNSIAGKVSKAGDVITTSNNYGLVINHTPVLGDFVDAFTIRSTTSGQRAQMGFATVDSDGDHHRASIRAYKGTQAFEGVFGVALRQPNASHIQRLTLDYLGNLTIGGALTESSSIKLKENVETSEGNLEKVVNLRPVTYNKIGSQTTELGLIAEEVATVYPEFVQYDESGEPVGVNYSRLTAALIGAVKELTNQVQELNKKING